MAWAFSSARARRLSCTPTTLASAAAGAVGIRRGGERERERKDNDEEWRQQPRRCCGAEGAWRLSTRCWRRFCERGAGAAQRGLHRRGGDRPRGRPELARRRQAGGDAGGAAAAVAGRTRARARCRGRPATARRERPPQMQLRGRSPPLMQLADSSDGCGDDCSVLTEPNVLPPSTTSRRWRRRCRAPRRGGGDRHHGGWSFAASRPDRPPRPVGRFWHKRATVLYNAEAFRSRIPIGGGRADADDLVDVIRDEDTGEVPRQAGARRQRRPRRWSTRSTGRRRACEPERRVSGRGRPVSGGRLWW